MRWRKSVNATNYQCTKLLNFATQLFSRIVNEIALRVMCLCMAPSGDYDFTNVSINYSCRTSSAAVSRNWGVGYNPKILVDHGAYSPWEWFLIRAGVRQGLGVLSTPSVFPAPVLMPDISTPNSSQRSYLNFVRVNEWKNEKARILSAFENRLRAGFV